MPPGLEQGQGVQCQGVQKPAAGLRVAGFEVGEHPHPFTTTRRNGNAEDVTQRMGLIGGDHKHPLPGACRTDGGGASQGGFPYPAFADEKADPGRGGRSEFSGLTQPRLVS